MLCFLSTRVQFCNSSTAILEYLELWVYRVVSMVPCCSPFRPLLAHPDKNQTTKRQRSPQLDHWMRVCMRWSNCQLDYRLGDENLGTGKRTHISQFLYKYLDMNINLSHTILSSRNQDEAPPTHTSNESNQITSMNILGLCDRF
jgi:hypothetical protein